MLLFYKIINIFAFHLEVQNIIVILLIGLIKILFVIQHINTVVCMTIDSAGHKMCPKIKCNIHTKFRI